MTYTLKPVFIEAEQLVRGHNALVVANKADVNLAGVFAVKSALVWANTGKGLFGMGSEMLEGTQLGCADNHQYFVRMSKKDFLAQYAQPAAPKLS